MMHAGWNDSAMGAQRVEAWDNKRLVRCFAERPTSFIALLENAKNKHPDKKALVFEQQRWTYQQTWDEVLRCAQALAGLGIDPQDRVLLSDMQKVYRESLKPMAEARAAKTPAKASGEADFQGQIVHPQFWPENLDYAGKKVVIIGSGATAITLVPNMTDKAAHVSMLQRSPTYILSVPSIDPISKALQAVLPAKLAYQLNRARNIGIQRTLYQASRKRPDSVRRFILSMIKRQLAGTNIEMRHFTPDYAPWDQRLCVVPNGDLFKVLRSGKASIHTDHIERFTESGILLKSGETLEADIIITATGLNVQLLGGVHATVDNAPIVVKEKLTYKGLMLDGVPNAAIVFGYTNASWTLKADLAAEYVCRLIKHMDRNGYKTVVPHANNHPLSEDTVLGGLASGYIRRAADHLPRQGTGAPWLVDQNYLRDIPQLRFSAIEDDVLAFDGKIKGKSSVERFTAPLRAAFGR